MEIGEDFMASLWEDYARAANRHMPAFRESVKVFDGLLAILHGHSGPPKQSGPPKLCIDGREYHGRQRRRTKGKR